MGKRGPKPKPIDHGTYSGWQLHHLRKIPVCPGCAAAKSRYSVEFNQRGKCVPGLGWPMLSGAATARYRARKPPMATEAA